MRITVLVLIALFPFSLFAQDNNNQEEVKKGEFSGQWRNYYLHTFNEGDLQNWYGLATGLKLSYKYNFNDNWQVGGALYSSINTGLSNVEVLDLTTGRGSRYVSGLFNSQDLSQKIIAFPGELYLQYKQDNHQIKIGRQGFKSPFLNGQDGRMIPTLFEGAFYKYEEKDKVKFQLGAINRIAPRSYDGFENIGESIGIYPVGRDVNGQASQYRGNTESDYIGVLNFEYNLNNLNVVVWDYYADNLFNMVYVKPSYTFSDSNFQFSAEWLLQNRVGNGGNETYEYRYVQDELAQLFGIQLSRTVKNGKLSLSYNYITDQGRYLFPREWGREFLFSFQKRERSEGFGDNQAVVFNYLHHYTRDVHDFKSAISVGHHWTPDVTMAELSKYALPNYMHINLDLFYENDNLKGFKPEILLTSKILTKDIPENPALVINKVNLFMINAIINYNF